MYAHFQYGRGTFRLKEGVKPEEVFYELMALTMKPSKGRKEFRNLEDLLEDVQSTLWRIAHAATTLPYGRKPENVIFIEEENPLRLMEQDHSS